MAFSLIIPPHKVKTGKLVVSCSNRRGGPFGLQISMPHSIFEGADLGKFEKIDVFWGSGADQGKLKIAEPVTGGGHFKPAFLKHCITLRLPPTADTPDFAMPPIDSEHRQVEGGLVITLPEWAWNAERQKSIKQARNQVARERASENGRVNK